MKYKKLIIISTNCLDRRINTLFGIKELVSAGIKVEYCNIGELTYHEHVVFEKVDGVILHDFKSKEEFYKYINENKGQPFLYIVYANYTPLTYFCYRALTRINADIAYCVNGVLPIQSLSTRIKSLTISKFLKAIENRIFAIIKKTGLLKPLKYQFNTCLKARVDYKVDRKTKYIPFNSTDYASTQDNLERIINEDYLVYIDQYLPHHPDNKIVGIGCVNSDDFYSKLNNLFDLVENNTGLRIVIAAHPTAVIYKTSNPFNNRPLFFNKTSQLVKYSSGLLLHHSAACFYGVLYYKSLLFITSNAIQKYMPMVDEAIYNLANKFGSTIVNLDNQNPSISMPSIDKKLYDQFKYNNITTLESENRKNSEILISVLRGDYE